MASPENGRATRFTMKPGVSRTRTGSFPMASARAMAAWIAASPEASPSTTSTSRIAGTGLKKCMPTTRSARPARAPICVTESAEVLVASTTSARHSRSSRSNSPRFSSRSSGAASMTKSTAAKSPRVVVVVMRPRIPATWALAMRPRLTCRSRSACTRRRAPVRAPGSMS